MKYESGQPHRRILLSPPHLTGNESTYIQAALESNWVAPVGPQVDAFESEFASYIGTPHALALSSGTAALHLALLVLGVGPGDDVLVSTLTFAASVNPILYVGATPTFIDSEPASWNLDPDLLERELERRSHMNRLPKAVIVVHLYGQLARIDAILEICSRYQVPVIEDAAEALGATHAGRHAGTFGTLGIFSFNGNKMITTSGGGMLVSTNAEFISRARKLATQAREPVAHYEHTEIGYNYRLSNILAAIGRAQLKAIDDRVDRRRHIFRRYVRGLECISELRFQPEAPWNRHARWLTCITIDDASGGVNSESLRIALEGVGIESRPVWKPMHLQPVFNHFPAIGGDVAERLFRTGLCLPSGSSMTDDDVDWVVTAIHRCTRRRRHANLQRDGAS